MTRSAATVVRRTHAPTPHYVERTDIYQLALLENAEPIADMTPVRRLTAAVTLLENAAWRAGNYRRFVEWDNRPVERIADPTAWITATPLFRAVVADLPTKRGRLAELAEQARHESTCTGGRCDCALLPAVDREVLAWIGAAILEARRGGAR